MKLVGVAVAAALLLWLPQAGASNGRASASCAFTARFQGEEYWGRYATVRPVPGVVLGTAVSPPCGGEKPWRIEVGQLDQIQPETAVVSTDSEIILVRRSIRQIPPEVQRYLEPPPCNSQDEPIDIQGTWLGILSAKGRTELDLSPPYDVTLDVETASSPAYERAEITVRVPKSLGKPISRRDIKRSLWKGGQIRVVARCVNESFRATYVEAYPA